MWSIQGLKMQRINLIDWTSAPDRSKLDYAKPTYSFLAFLVFKISLDALPGSHPQI
jgi:hypothetical protein